MVKRRHAREKVEGVLEGGRRFSKNIEPGPINVTEVFFALPLYDLQHRILVPNMLAGEPLDVRGDKTGPLGGIHDN